MASEVIQRKNLLRSVTNLKLKHFLKAAKQLGFLVTQPKGGSSHFAIRKEGFDQHDIRGVVAVVYEHILSVDKPKVVKDLIVKGERKEDDVWKALGLL